MSKMFSLLLVLAVSFMMVPANVVAEQKEMSIEDLLFMDIPKVLTASKYEQSVLDTPSVISVVTKEEIKKFGANNLHDIINRTASAYTIGNYLTVDGLTSLRGDLIFGQDLHVLILMNGRPLRESVGGYNMPIYEGFPVEIIERLEIIRGPGSVLYGSNAYVGIINIITKKTDNNQTTAEVGGGSFGTTFGSVMNNYKKNDLSMTSAAKYFDSTGWDFKATGWIPPASVGPTKSVDYAKNNYSLTSVINYKNFTFNILAVQLRDSVVNATMLWPSKSCQMMDDRLFADAGYKYTLSDAWYIDSNLTFNYHYMTFTQNAQNKHKSLDYLAESTLFGRVMDEKLNIVFGALINKLTHPEKGQLIGSGTKTDYPIGTIDQNNFSSYLQLDYKINNSLSATTGVQYNQPYKGYPGTVPRFGIVAKANNELGLKLSYAEAFRSPAPIETNINHTVLLGNPDLESENIATLDAQVFYNLPKSQTALTYFESRYYNMIIRMPTSTPGLSTYTNGNGVKVSGYEVEEKLSLRPDLKMVGSYSYQKNKSDDGIDDYMAIANHMVKLGFIYDMKSNISFGLFDQYYSKPPDIKATAPARLLVNPVPDAYHWLTLNVAYKATDKLEFNLYGTNILDQDVYYPEFGKKAVNSIPGEPGLGVYFKASLTL